MVADGVVVSADGLVGVVDAPIAFGHLPCTFAALGFVLAAGAAVAFLVLGGGIEIFPYGKECIALLNILFGTTGREEDERHSIKNDE
jgi:hypothetical protein